MSVTLRIFFLAIFHPNQPSSFAPDEGTYARLAEFVSRGLAVQDFPEYGPALYNQSKSLVNPSSLLIKIGVDPLDSVRIVSAIYGFFVPFFALLCFVAVQKSRVNLKEITFENKSVFAKSFIVMLFFLPSNFLWSTLGLRESASQFWILAQTYFIIKFYNEVKYARLVFAFLAIISSVFSFTARPQTALLISIFLIFLGVVVTLKKRAFSFLLVSILCTISGNAFASTPEVQLIVKYKIIEKVEILSENDSKNVEEKSSKKIHKDTMLCSYPNQIILVSKQKFECVLIKEYKKPLLPPLTSLPQNIDVSMLEERRNVNRVGASSALAPSLCSKSINNFASIKCNLSEIPYRLTALLVRPFPFVDKGSPFLLFAGLENLLWLILFLVTLTNLVRLRSQSLFKDYILSIASFLILFSTAVSLYEGNMGTAFRHKSTLLGHLILLNILAMWSPNFRILSFSNKKTK